MSFARKKVIVLIILFGLLALGSWWYYFRILTVNYLIPGVPYNGIYNVFYKDANSSVITSVMDILGYWGDERFSIQELNEKFSPPIGSPFSQGRLLATIKIFFEDNGYESYQWISPESGNELKEVKKFVNPAKKTPVMVFQNRSFEGLSTGPRVVIGIFDKEKKVIVHDDLLGNNYEIPYGDFEKMFTQNARAILAFRPSDKIKELIKGPNYNTVYPLRLEAMDKLGPILTSKLAEATFYRLTAKDYAKSNAAYKDFVNDQNFKYLPPAFQVTILSVFAHTYVFLKQYDEAISAIKERVLPINHNRSEAPEGWFVPPSDKAAYPYFVLSIAYLRNGQKDLAIAAYKDYKEIQSINNSIYENLGETYLLRSPSLIEELEKAISSKK